MPAAATAHPPEDIRFDQAATTLAELYGPVFAVIVQLRSTDHYGDSARLRQRLDDLLSEAEQQAAAAGAPPEDVADATFAVVAFLDEAILSSDWPEKHAWLSRPLQLERFERYDAGEAFFDRLGSLLDQPHRAEVLEIYYLCMTLGFKGQYQIHGQNELRQLIERSHSVLSRAPGMGPRPLSPRGTPGASVEGDGGPRFPPWMLLAAAAAVALLVYVGMSLYVSGTAGGVAEALQALVTASPTP